MPRYFFDIQDGRADQRDEVGVELPDLEAVRMEVTRSLPAIASDDIARHGDRQCLTMLVTDAKGHPVYSATLAYAGLWLSR